ncbi:hypothetical protein Nepgr_030653 [Nepenthes gracilis]|uniref:Uncharacterized protein n=1 Tax=Nepenthes gracilis TaxID=150966 RepID=A0AAD3TFQ0_NEPGR|nr:hypothetical protein Nepgr_030653 [Nepenthes gracilis]
MVALKELDRAVDHPSVCREGFSDPASNVEDGESELYPEAAQDGFSSHDGNWVRKIWDCWNKKKKRKENHRAGSSGAIEDEENNEPKLVRSGGMRRDWSFECLDQADRKRKKRRSSGTTCCFSCHSKN